MREATFIDKKGGIMKKRILVAIFVGLMMANGFLGIVPTTCDAGDAPPVYPPVTYKVYLGTMTITGGQDTWSATAVGSNIIKNNLHKNDKIKFYVKCKIVNDPEEMVEKWEFITHCHVGSNSYPCTFIVDEYPPDEVVDDSGLRTILLGTLTVQSNYDGYFDIQCKYYNVDWTETGLTPQLRCTSNLVQRTIDLTLA